MKFLKISLAVCVGLLVANCQKEDYAVSPPASGISFEVATDNIEVDPANPVYDLKVTATTVSSVDRTLTYTVNTTSTTADEDEYSYIGTVTIPAGSLFGTTPINFDVASLVYTAKAVSFDLAIPDESYGYKISGKQNVIINYKKVCDQNDVAVTFVFDQYAEETYWSLVNLAAPTVVIANVVAGTYDGLTTATEKFCLAPGNYRLVLRDSYGDGFCCDYGDGSYAITVNGNQVAAGTGSFATSKNVNFLVQ